MKDVLRASITHRGHRQNALLVIAGMAFLTLAQPGLRADDAAARAQFELAWQAAARGDQQAARRLGQGLEPYILYPYLRYEDYRVRRARVDAATMARFLADHDDWAFARGLKIAWLRTLGERRQWSALLRHAPGIKDTEVRCYLAQARLAHGQVDGLLQEVQSLWTVGKSQPDSCDPAFAWLRDSGGITPALAWERVRLAMRAGNPRFTLYLARFIPAPERVWLERWQRLNSNRYRNLGQAVNWPDRALTRMITSVSLERLARHDADAAMQTFTRLDGHFNWDPDVRGSILREIALQAAIDLLDDAPAYLSAVPADHRDEQLLEWWARVALVRSDWPMLQHAIEQMPRAVRGDGRWRYWLAVANAEQGRTGIAEAMLEALSLETTYHGFLAADRLGAPYTICPLEPVVSQAQVARLRARPDFARALELRRAGIGNWAVLEWNLAAARLDAGELRAAAALARAAHWHDRVIFALGDSGDRRFYEWRFPVLWEPLVMAEAGRQNLDPAWVYGVMRSESALDENARSSAGALGLMQVMPATARRLARANGLSYTSSGQLRNADQNIRYGTTFMRELLDRYDQNPVLVAGAYNAGPRVVDRWLDSRPAADAAVWVESIPYYETRAYIPRVLAFTAIYDWRLQKPVQRVSSRMPGLDSGNMVSHDTADVVCLASG